MPQRNPNQLLGKSSADPLDRGGHPYYYVEASPPARSKSPVEHEDDPDTLAAAKREIKRLKEAIKSLEACVKPKAQDTSAAWRAEAERYKAKADTFQKDNELLMQDLSAARDALAQQMSQSKAELEEAVEKEAKRWKDRLQGAGQESDELRRELEQTLGRFEELEMAKTNIMFELTAERSRVQPKTIDPELYENTLGELTETRHRLSVKESEMVKQRESAKAEAEACEAELQQNISYLRRVLKEQKAELSTANEATAEADARYTTLAADFRRLQASAEALQQEKEMLCGLQRQWEDWSQQAEETLWRDAREMSGTGQELADLKMKLKGLEDRAEKCAAEASRRVSQLTARLPKPALKAQPAH